MVNKLKNIVGYISLFLALISGFSLPVNASEKKVKHNIANTWVFVPKAGRASDFEQAFKKHIAFRKAQNDPRSWQVYRADMGSDMNAYYVRYCCASWSELDDYQKWSTGSKSSENWQKNVSQFVSHYGRHRSEIDFKNSHWGDKVKFKYVGVSNYEVKVGHYQAIVKDKKIFSDAAKKENWPYHWSWSDSINGTGPMSLAIPYINYGAMAPPEIKFSEMLAKYLGSKDKAKAVLERWRSHFKSISYNIYVLQDDLSM